MKTLSSLSLTVALSATLAACGGGGGGSASPPPPPPAPASVTLTGTAAVGAALPGATVDIKCAGASASGVTASDGRFSITVAGGSLPCVLKATAAGGTVLHSLRLGSESSGSFAANITPLTELALARAAGAAPASVFAGFSAGTAPSAAALSQAIEALRAVAAGRVDLAGVNPFTDALVAASGGTPGNALDQKLDALAAALTAARTSLAALTAALASNPGATDPVRGLLQPAAASCAWLRSGTYRVISPTEPTLEQAVQLIDFDAGTLTVSSAGQPGQTFTAAGPCRFTAEDAQQTTTAVVSSAGLIVVQSQSKAAPTDIELSIALPEQSLPLADFAGTWNVADWSSDSGNSTTDYVAGTVEITFNATGQVTAARICEGLAECQSATSGLPSVAANAGGGFDLRAGDGGLSIGRVFLFKNAEGQPLLLGFLEGGELLVGTPKRSLGALPAVGTVTPFRELALIGNGRVDPLAERSTTVTAVDAAARTVSRVRAGDLRGDTVAYDRPRDGLRYRAPNSCTANGQPQACAETVQLPLQGMGITLSLSVPTAANPALSFFYISIGRPAD